MAYPSKAGRDRRRDAPGLISRVHAAVAAGFAPHLDAGERRKPGLQVLPDPHGDILQARDLESVDLVQIFVVQPLAQFQAALLDFAQVGDEPGLWIDLSQQNDARDEGMSVQPVVGMAFRHAGKAVRRVEAEFLVDLHSTFYLIPRNLCVCRERRHLGCRMQYATARSVFACASGPSMGCNRKCSKESASYAEGDAPAWG